MSSRGSERGVSSGTRRSRTRSSSEDNLLDCSHSSARLALQQEVLPGAVKSGSLESLLRGEYNLLDCSHSSASLVLQEEVLPGEVESRKVIDFKIFLKPSKVELKIHCLISIVAVSGLSSSDAKIGSQNCFKSLPFCKFLIWQLYFQD